MSEHFVTPSMTLEKIMEFFMGAIEKDKAKPKSEGKPNRWRMGLELRLADTIVKNPGITAGKLRNIQSACDRPQVAGLLKKLEVKGLVHPRYEKGGNGHVIERWHPGPGEVYFAKKQGK